jgi:hypothetical protein
VKGGRLLASPSDRVTEKVRELVTAHRDVLFSALAREPAHAHEGTHEARPEPAPLPSPGRGAECMRCANLKMRVEHPEGTPRVFFWRCAKGHALMEGRDFGARVLLAPPECEAAGDWKPWECGQR